MNGDSRTSKSINGGRSRLRFGMRSVFLLVGLAALVAWWARGEMLEEQRREELLLSLGMGNDLWFKPNPPVAWRRRLGAWLRGKPPTADVGAASISNAPGIARFGEFIEAFPEATLDVDLQADQATPEMLDLLASISTLDSLSIRGALAASDETLSRLAKIRPKRALMFGATRVDDELLRRAADAKVDLGWIYDLDASDRLGWGLVTDDGLRAAARFPKLTWLSAGRLGRDEGLAAFKAHPAVHDVVLTGPGYTDLSAETLATLPRLSSLALKDTQLTDAGIARAIEGRQLSRLELHNAALGEKSIAAIAGMTSLRQISLHDVPVSPELAAAIAKHPIESLRLDGPCTDNDLKPLAPIGPSLLVISLSAPNVTDEGLAWLASAGKLIGLQMSDTQATVATIKLISTPRPMQTFDLGGPNIDAAVLRQATSSLKLQTIRLFGPSIDNDALAGLEPTYSSLALVGTNVDATGLRSLKTSGKTIRVFVWHPEGTPPPLAQQEIEEIKQATAGLIEVSLSPIESEIFERAVPKSLRKSSVEVAPR